MSDVPVLVRHRWLLLAAPVVAVAVAAAVLGPVRGSEEALMPVDPATSDQVPLGVSVQAGLRGPEGLGLQVTAPAGRVLFAEHEARLRLTWTAAADRATPVSLPYVGFAQEVPAQEGSGAIGVTDGHCHYWDDLGRPTPHSCPYIGDTLLAPGQSTTTPVVVADVVSSGQATAGTYRVSIPVGSLGAAVDLVLEVSGSRQEVPPAPGRVTGQVVAIDRTGAVVPAAILPPTSISLWRVRSGDTAGTTTDSTGRFVLALLPGVWQVDATTSDGRRCVATGIDVHPGDQTLEILCQIDGPTP